MNASVHGRRTPPARAFTLIELLVALTVIALLLAIALPALAGARRAGTRTACLANLRSLGTALLSYRAENKDRFPDAPELPDLPKGRPGVIAALADRLDAPTPRLTPTGAADPCDVVAPWRCPADRDVAPRRGSSYAYDVGGLMGMLRIDGVLEPLSGAGRIIDANHRWPLFSDAPPTARPDPAAPPWHPRRAGEPRHAVYADGRADWREAVLDVKPY